MQFSISLTTLLSAFVHVIGAENPTWATCQSFPANSLCPSWCGRLNIYSEKYAKIRNSEIPYWQEFAYLIVSLLFLIGIFAFLGHMYSKAAANHAAERKSLIHKKKMRLLRKSRMTGKMLKMESEDEREPNPAKERPVSNMVLQEMWQKDGAEKAYFDYREKRMNAEAELQMLDGAEKLRIMKYFNSFNVIPNKKVDMAAEITVIPDPVIGNEHMELDWQIVLCNEKGEDIEETVPIDEVRPEDA